MSVSEESEWQWKESAMSYYLLSVPTNAHKCIKILNYITNSCNIVIYTYVCVCVCVCVCVHLMVQIINNKNARHVHKKQPCLLLSYIVVYFK